MYRVKLGHDDNIFFSHFHPFCMFLCTIFLYGDCNVRSGNHPRPKWSQTFQVFKSMLKNVKLERSEGISICFVKYFHHGLLNAHNIFIDLRKILCNILFHFLVCGERIENFRIHRMYGIHWSQYFKPSIPV